MLIYNLGTDIVILEANIIIFNLIIYYYNSNGAIIYNIPIVA